MATQFTPTHITTDGQFVQMINPAHDTTGPGTGEIVALAATRTGRTVTVLATSVHELGTEEAAGILDSLGVRSELECQMDDSHRVTTARWSQAVDASRAALAHGVSDVLGMSGDVDNRIGFNARRRLEQATEEAARKLAEFRP